MPLGQKKVVEVGGVCGDAVKLERGVGVCGPEGLPGVGAGVVVALDEEEVSGLAGNGKRAEVAVIGKGDDGDLVALVRVEGAVQGKSFRKGLAEGDVRGVALADPGGGIGRRCGMAADGVRGGGKGLAGGCEKEALEAAERGVGRGDGCEDRGGAAEIGAGQVVDVVVVAQIRGLLEVDAALRKIAAGGVVGADGPGAVVEGLRPGAFGFGTVGRGGGGGCCERARLWGEVEKCGGFPSSPRRWFPGRGYAE